MSLTNEFKSFETFELSGIGEIQELAARLHKELGELDDAAIQAVAEATGAPEDYVRLAVRSATVPKKASILDRLKSSFRAFDPATRRHAIAGVLGLGAGLMEAVRMGIQDASGLMGTLGLVLVIAALANSAVAKKSQVAAISGGVFGGVAFVALTLFTFLLGLLPNVPSQGPAPALLLVAVGASAALGLAANAWYSRVRKSSTADAVNERHSLLQQLQDIQQKLRSDERFVTFLSVDIVGSTRIKADNDDLDVEFTFNEYHRYVQTVAEKHGGRLHSTAGDGVTCVFESPVHGAAAGKAVLSGLFEFNAFRNKLNREIELRAGVHTGSVLAPGQDLVSVNFAHVIDVCAHLQKAGEPGTLVVSEHTAQYLPGGLDGISSERVEAHETRAAVWRPRARVAAKTLTARPV
ncbi:MAG: adenylate/guanylate cyclase domain-containing protein [Fimbriimonadaceae bacterium]|nr:adenylate/guanylate cyclase domain-containing protein [Fimbriimonadaceae bacterium]QYK55803.1 MAG: adenylate/guanylate cyclase domain-containing protein [Fimbriimonadaceae bacterium]